MKIRLIWFAILILLLSSWLMAAGAPLSEKDIPIYPGTVRNTAAEKELLSQNSEYDEEIQNTCRSNTIKLYTTKAQINEVCKFYIDKLSAKPGAPVVDPGHLKPGAVIPPWFELGYYEPDIFENQYERDTLIHDGKWVRSIFAKRPQWKKDAWLSSAWFEWNVLLNNGDMAQYTVSVEDEGFDARKKLDFNATRITIQILVTKSEASMEEDEDEEMDEAVAQKARQLAKNPPTEKSLGIPFYPGSVFNPEHSAGMSLDDEYQYYIYLSNDPPAKVLAFYEQHLEKKASTSNAGYLITLKGKLPVPDEGLAIQPNTMFGGKAKTVITVQKQVR